MKALSWHLVNAGAVIFFGFMFLGIIVLMTQHEDANQYEQSAPEGKLYFRRPRASRVFGALVSLSFLGGIPMFAGVILNPKSFGATTGSNSGDIGLVSIFCLMVSFGFSLLAGPDELSIDLSARTYRRTWGWPLFPKVASGSTSQISGVCVRDVGTVSNPVFHVCLRWRGNKGISIVGRCDRSEEAETAASKLQQALGLQRVEPPFW